MIGPRTRVVLGLARILLGVAASWGLAVAVPVALWWAFKS